MYSLARICTFVGLAASSAMAFVLPSLSAWTELHTNALINAQTVTDLNAAADAFLSQNISIVVNGASLTRSQFLKTLAVNLPGRVSGNVSYTAIIEDPTDPSNSTAAGWVGVFLVSSNFYTSHSLIESSSNNVLIQQDPAIPVPPTLPGGIRGDFDGRRVMVFNSVTVVDT
ncbi:hypothetical protein HYPSUDRAFT_205555 [Hypholoma sublateritium FD-334 SS-4]|uniref:Uncharacterized protein n=1 Tax=Hypholoma sublateritium (strain FD-334 SS-4) TaxID=945553 RepID=A0A0D2NGX0_HYPSF|nr:hypothetical protein HYPSUDRAFT_205555 [Hypholoma sublateritium FD-334 SS-4]